MCVGYYQFSDRLARSEGKRRNRMHRSTHLTTVKWLAAAHLHGGTVDAWNVGGEDERGGLLLHVHCQRYVSLGAGGCAAPTLRAPTLGHLAGKPELLSILRLHVRVISTSVNLVKASSAASLLQASGGVITGYTQRETQAGSFSCALNFHVHLLRFSMR